MSLMLFSDANVGYLKRQLRAKYPQIKSGHLSEAIAFSAGYRTHAALTAKIKELSNGRDFLVGMNAGQMALRLRELDYPIASIGDLEPITQAYDLPNRMYAVTKNRDRQQRDEWFTTARCDDDKQSAIVVELEWFWLRLCIA